MPARLLRILAVVVAGLFAAGVALVLSYRWEGEHPSFLQPKARAAHAAFMASGLRLVTPPGPGPFPTVLLIHGCGGLRGDHGPNPIMDEYARSATEAGWAGAILDSYAPRGWGPAWARRRVCAGVRLNGLMRSADILAGLDLLAADPRVDHRHIRIAGWSHGGWALGDLLTLKDRGDGQFRRTMSAVEAVQFTYPYCARPARAARWPWTWSGAVRLVLAQHDTVQDPAGCMPLVAQARRAGARVEVITIPGVTHAFDERVQTPTSPFKFDPAATARSHADFEAWLKEGPTRADGSP
jgi:dienelactone hydrolase